MTGPAATFDFAKERLPETTSVAVDLRSDCQFPTHIAKTNLHPDIVCLDDPMRNKAEDSVRHLNSRSSWEEGSQIQRARINSEENRILHQLRNTGGWLKRTPLYTWAPVSQSYYQRSPYWIIKIWWFWNRVDRIRWHHSPSFLSVVIPLPNPSYPAFSLCCVFTLCFHPVCHTKVWVQPLSSCRALATLDQYHPKLYLSQQWWEKQRGRDWDREGVTEERRKSRSAVNVFIAVNSYMFYMYTYARFIWTVVGVITTTNLMQSDSNTIKQMGTECSQLDMTSISPGKPEPLWPCIEGERLLPEDKEILLSHKQLDDKIDKTVFHEWTSGYLLLTKYTEVWAHWI